MISNTSADLPYSHIGIGAVFGFVLFIGLLEGRGMGQILWRDGQFTPSGLSKYMKSPFVQKYLWYPRLWRHNWIIMTIGGGAIGALIGSLTGKYFG